MAQALRRGRNDSIGLSQNDERIVERRPLRPFEMVRNPRWNGRSRKWPGDSTGYMKSERAGPHLPRKTGPFVFFRYSDQAMSG